MRPARGILWDRRLETGDEFIDGQHLRLYAMVNDVYMMAADGSRALAIDSLLRLLEEVEMHLAFEHDLLEAAGHPTLDECQADGKRFCDTFSRLATSCLADPHVPVDEVLVFTQTWLATHVADSGKSFERYRPAFAAAG